MRMLVAGAVLRQDAANTAMDSMSGDASLAQPSAATSALPERTGPPDTVSAMETGYIVATVIFLAYIALLMRRVATVRRSP